MRLRVFFSFQVRLHRSKRAPVRRNAPSVPGRAVAGLFFAPSSAWSEKARLPCPGGQLRGFFRSKFGLDGESGRRCAEARLPCPGGRLRRFFFAPSSAWSEKGAPVRRSAPSVPGRAVAGIFFRSKFGFIGASVRRCAEARLPCPGGQLRGCFSLLVRLGRRKRAQVRRCAPSVPGRAVAGLFFVPSSAWSEKAGAGASMRAFRARAGGCEAVFAIRHVLKVLSFRT